MTLCCVRGVWLPQLPGGYLWLPLVTMQRYQVLHDSAVYVEYGYLSYLVVTCGYYVLPALPGIA